jgi:hypothetical protein
LTLASGLPVLGPIDPGLVTNDFLTGLEPEHTAAIFVDLDGDSNPEVIEYGVSCSTLVPNPRALRYDPEEGLLKPFSIGLPQERPMAAADLDGDGSIDLIMGRGEPAIMWGPLQGLRNYKTVRGEIVSPVCDGVHGIQLVDFDQDGLLDLLVSLATCEGVVGPGPSVRLYLNKGDRSFEDRSDDLLEGTADSAGYTAFMTTFGLGRRMLVTAPLPCGSYGALGFFESLGLNDDGYPVFSDLDPTPRDEGVRLVVPEHEQDMPLWYFIPMGMVTGDVNNDGRFDLMVALHPFHTLFVADEEDNFRDESMALSFTWMDAPESDRHQYAWGMALLDIDQDGRQDFLAAHGDDFLPFEHGRPEAIGPQQLTAHWNGGSLAFAEITESIGLGQKGNYRGLSYGDLDGDGDADLLLGGKGIPPRVLRNDVTTPNKGFSLRLKGTSSNQSALGAEVYVETIPGGKVQRFLVGAQASPNTSSEGLIFVGLGNHDEASLVRVRWPSGIESRHTGLTSGTLHTLIEPEVLQLSPLDRHKPADGASLAELHVRPRKEDGSLDPGAEVNVAITHGGGVLEEPKQSADGGVIIRVRAPGQKGSTRLSITINGETLSLYPRLWWD